MSILYFLFPWNDVYNAVYLSETLLKVEIQLL